MIGWKIWSLKCSEGFLFVIGDPVFDHQKEPRRHQDKHFDTVSW